MGYGAIHSDTLWHQKAPMRRRTAEFFVTIPIPNETAAGKHLFISLSVHLFIAS
jgi:hypothetical protein